MVVRYGSEECGVVATSFMAFVASGRKAWRLGDLRVSVHQVYLLSSNEEHSQIDDDTHKVQATAYRQGPASPGMINFSMT